MWNPQLLCINLSLPFLSDSMIYSLQIIFMVFVEKIRLFSNVSQLIKNKIPDWKDIHSNRRKNILKSNDLVGTFLCWVKICILFEKYMLMEKIYAVWKLYSNWNTFDVSRNIL